MSYYASLQSTREFNRFWIESHKLTRWGLATLNGLDNLTLSDGDPIPLPERIALWRFIKESLIAREVDNFQTYVVELISAILQKKPAMIPSGKIDAQTVFQFESLDDLRKLVVENMASKYSYMNIIDLGDELQSKYSFALFPSRIRKLRVKRLVGIRNLIVHNRGLVNRRFVDDCGSKHDALGKPVNIPGGTRTASYLLRAAEDIDKLACDKFEMEAE